MKTPVRSPGQSARNFEKQILLQQTLAPFTRWDEWCRTRWCPLSPNETEIINSFRLHNSVDPAAGKLNRSRQYILSVLNECIRKLPRVYKAYELWLTLHYLQQAGNMDLFDRKELFLLAPLYIHDFSPRTKNLLSTSGFNNLKEVADLSDKELLKIRGLGKKGIEEIRNILEKRDYRELLTSETASFIEWEEIKQ